MNVYIIKIPLTVKIEVWCYWPHSVVDVRYSDSQTFEVDSRSSASHNVCNEALLSWGFPWVLEVVARRTKERFTASKNCDLIQQYESNFWTEII